MTVFSPLFALFSPFRLRLSDLNFIFSFKKSFISIIFCIFADALS